jgi:hypothetical protein
VLLHTVKSRHSSPSCACVNRVCLQLDLDHKTENCHVSHGSQVNYSWAEYNLELDSNDLLYLGTPPTGALVQYILFYLQSTCIPLKAYNQTQLFLITSFQSSLNQPQRNLDHTAMRTPFWTFFSRDRHHSRTYPFLLRTSIYLELE